jgi:hypothetical protein
MSSVFHRNACHDRTRTYLHFPERLTSLGTRSRKSPTCWPLRCLRLRAHPATHSTIENSERVRLGFCGHQRVNANPDHNHGVRP